MHRASRPATAQHDTTCCQPQLSSFLLSRSGRQKQSVLLHGFVPPSASYLGNLAAAYMSPGRARPARCSTSKPCARPAGCLVQPPWTLEPAFFQILLLLPGAKEKNL